MRTVYLISGGKFNLIELIFGDDRVQGKDYNTGKTITVFKTNIAHIEG